MRYINIREKEVLTESAKEMLIRLAVFSIMMLVLQMLVRISYSNDHVLIFKKEDIFIHSILFGCMGIVGSYPLLKKPVEDVLDFYGFECGFEYVYDKKWQSKESKEVRIRRTEVRNRMFLEIAVQIMIISVVCYHLASFICTLFGV